MKNQGKKYTCVKFVRLQAFKIDMMLMIIDIGCVKIVKITIISKH